MEKRSFDGHDIDDVQANQRRAEKPGEIESVRLCVTGMFGGVDADEDLFDQVDDLRASYRDNMRRGSVSRGRVPVASNRCESGWTK
jgi:hypothetical protein